MSPALLELQEVSLLRNADGDRPLAAVDRACLRLEAGQLVTLAGPSGCGKTSLLRILAGFLRPSSGRVLLEGQALGRMPDAILARWRAESLGFVFQTSGLVPDMGVAECVALPLLNGRLRLTQVEARAAESLARCRIAHRSRALCRELSVGEQQRVALARALVNRPRLLLADEPSSALDPELSALVGELLRQAARAGACVVVASHGDQRLSLGEADRHLRMHQGRVEEAS